MAETLTESFCERCGTRYEFKAPTRLNPLRKTRGLVGGLRNYLTSQDAFSDAIGDAMRTEEDGLASAQLEAFHESFNFCIDCRQYTCINCWNDTAGRCRSCAPIAGTDDVTERLAAAFDGAVGIQPEPAPLPLELDAWPMSDLPLSPTIGGNGHPVEDWPGAELVRDTPVDPILAQAGREPEPEPVVAEVEPEPEPVVAEAQPIWPELDALEREPIAAEIEIEPVRLPLRVVAWDEDIEVEPEPEPVAAELEPEPEAKRRLTPIHETILHFPTRPVPTPTEVEQVAAAAEVDTPELAARRAQLDDLGLGGPDQAAAEPAVLPYRSRGAATTPADLARAAALRGSFWEASAREVASAGAHVGVQSCGQCGLSLSANARFCRRCGTRQAQSA